MKILIAITLVIALVALALSVYALMGLQKVANGLEELVKGFNYISDGLEQMAQQMKDAEASMMMQLQMMMPESQEFLQ